MTIPEFPKPSQKEGKITLTPRQRRIKRDVLYTEQMGLCAECRCHMTLLPFHLNSAELDHIKPQPAGCKKDDNDDNLQVLCHDCNFRKGSRR